MVPWKRIKGSEQDRKKERKKRADKRKERIKLWDENRRS